MDINAFSNNDDLKHLAQIFSLAYLKNQGLAFTTPHPKNKTKIEIDNEWHFGGIHLPPLNVPIIKTKDKSLFAFCCTSTLSDKAVSDTILLLYTNIIAFLLVTNHATLPCKNLKIAYCLNHDNEHFTMMIANFKGMSHKQYQALYKAYQKKYNPHHLIIKEQYERAFWDPLQKAKSFLQTQHTNSKIKPLPLEVDKLLLTHYDSLNTNHSDAKKYVQPLISRHRAKFTKGYCPTQHGNTCGEWSVFNAFHYAVLDGKGKKPTSTALRTLYNKLNRNTDLALIKEANKILDLPRKGLGKVKTLAPKKVIRNPSVKSNIATRFNFLFLTMAIAVFLFYIIPTAGISLLSITLTCALSAGSSLSLLKLWEHFSFAHRAPVSTIRSSQSDFVHNVAIHSTKNIVPHFKNHLFNKKLKTQTVLNKKKFEQKIDDKKCAIHP